MDGLKAIVERPSRWEIPFGEGMTAQVVDRLMSLAPFAQMDESCFPPHGTLRDILQNDCRVVEYRDGDIVTLQGQYGTSAFMILDGTVRVTLELLPATMLGQPERHSPSLLRTLTQLWRKRAYPETRPRLDRSAGAGTGRRESATGKRIFLRDVPGVLDQYNSLALGAGEVFGELAALTRTPRSSTVFAEGRVELLEMRWQGLRDIMQRAPQFRQHIDDLYRQNSLLSHLRETSVLSSLPAETFADIVAGAEFESYGSFDWHHKFEQPSTSAAEHSLDDEPLIVEEGHYPNGLILIRSGFARLSRRKGNGHQTSAYLAKGQYYGLGELAHNWSESQNVAYQQSLRAVGYVDVIRIPTRIVEQSLLPHLNRYQIRGLIAEAMPSTDGVSGPSSQQAPAGVETGLLEFLVESRLMNGTQTMMLDLDRCTRCDDCVKACEATHDGNPRFIRDGLRYGNLQFANACMHCADPVCMIGCPTGAISRDAKTGNVLIHESTCIGCGTCASSCPYHNIQMVEIRDHRGHVIVDQELKQPVQKATKCDLCTDQLGGPACQRACPHDALVRIDMSDLKALGNFVTR